HLVDDLRRGRLPARPAVAATVRSGGPGAGNYRRRRDHRGRGLSSAKRGAAATGSGRGAAARGAALARPAAIGVEGLGQQLQQLLLLGRRQPIEEIGWLRQPLFE